LKIFLLLPIQVSHDFLKGNRYGSSIVHIYLRNSSKISYHFNFVHDDVHDVQLQYIGTFKKEKKKKNFFFLMRIIKKQNLFLRINSAEENLFYYCSLWSRRTIS